MCQKILSHFNLLPSPDHHGWRLLQRDDGFVTFALFRWACVFSKFYSNFWLIFGKLWEARSRLYRSRFLQVNTRLNSYLVRKEDWEKGTWREFESSWRDLQDLHVFAPLESLSIQNVSQISSNFFAISQLYFQKFTDFPKKLSKFTNFDERSPEFQHFLRIIP